MTSIKPPGSAPTTDLPTAPYSVGQKPGGVSAPDVASGSGPASFTEQLHAARGLATQAPAGGTGDVMSALSRDLKAGKLTMEQALDVLVERAATGVGSQLGSQERAELLSVLRNALASDPTLASLRDSGR